MLLSSLAPQMKKLDPRNQLRAKMSMLQMLADLEFNQVYPQVHGFWDPEPLIILETVGETGLLYEVRPEKGGKEKVQTPVARPTEEEAIIKMP